MPLRTQLDQICGASSVASKITLERQRLEMYHPILLLTLVGIHSNKDAFGKVSRLRLQYAFSAELLYTCA